MPEIPNPEHTSGPEPKSNPVFDNILQAVGPERANKLFTDFTIDTRVRLEQIDDATAEGDVTRLQKEAHDLRGTAGHFGFAELCNLAGEIETACRSGDTAGAFGLAHRIRQAGAAVLEAAAGYESVSKGVTPGASDT